MVPEGNIDDIRDLDIELVGDMPAAQDLTVTLTGPADGGMTETITLLDSATIEEGPYDIRLSDPDGPCDDVDPASVVLPATLAEPEEALSTFDGQPLAGTWTLNVIDDAGGDIGVLNGWCLAEGAGGQCCNNQLVSIPGSDPLGVTTTLQIGDVTDCDDGTETPATGPWGGRILIVAIMAASLLFLRKRALATRG